MSCNKFSIAAVLLLVTVLSVRAQRTCSPESERYRCGFRGIDAFLCQTIGCCWETSAEPTCFLPDQLKPGYRAETPEPEAASPSPATGEAKVSGREIRFDLSSFDGLWEQPKTATETSGRKKSRPVML